jgi:hypothetical protein
LNVSIAPPIPVKLISPDTVLNEPVILSPKAVARICSHPYTVFSFSE